MALIKCPGCGNDVSTDSLECPKCGEPIQYKEVEKIDVKKEIKTHFISIISASLISIIVLTVLVFTTEINFYLEIAIMANMNILVFSIKELYLWQKINRTN